MVKRKKIYLGFLRDRLRWLAFPHDLASVPLADVECYTRRVFIHFLARDDIVVMVVAAVAGQFNLVYRTNREFCSASEDGKRVLSNLFRMSLNESCYVLSELSRVCRRNGSSDDRFDKCDVFHNGIRWKSLTYRQFRCFGF